MRGGWFSPAFGIGEVAGAFIYLQRALARALTFVLFHSAGAENTEKTRQKLHRDFSPTVQLHNSSSPWRRLFSNFSPSPRSTGIALFCTGAEDSVVTEPLRPITHPLKFKKQTTPGQVSDLDARILLASAPNKWWCRCRQNLQAPGSPQWKTKSTHIKSQVLIGQNKGPDPPITAPEKLNLS